MKKIFLAALCICCISLFALPEPSTAGEYTITKWRAFSKCRSKKGALVSLRYTGGGSRILKNSCFSAVFQDGSSCEGLFGDFNDVRIEDDGKELSRYVCFCSNRYKIKKVIYTCGDGLN